MFLTANDERGLSVLSAATSSRRSGSRSTTLWAPHNSKLLHLGHEMHILNRTSAANITPEYAPIIPVVVAEYRRILRDDLLSVRLLGSVARGEAVPQLSDIDFVALVRSSPSTSVIAALRATERLLTSRFPIVSRVDMAVDARDDLQEVRRFILSIDSLLVHGSDSLPDTSDTDRTHLVDMVTPSARDTITMYRTALIEGADGIGSAPWCRVIAKDLLRILRGLALSRGAPFEAGIQSTYQSMRVFVPEHAALADLLYKMYCCPDADPRRMLDALARVDETLA